MNVSGADGAPQAQAHARSVLGSGKPWRPEVVIFNLLPSLTLHPERRSQFADGCDWSFIGDTSEKAAIMHRHWSRAILKALRLENRIVEDTDGLALRVALLSVAELDRLARWLGVQLCATPFRTAIRGEDVRRMMSMPDAHVIEALRQSTEDTRDDLYAPARSWPVEQALACYVELGIAALLFACESAGEALGTRLALKLAPAGYWDEMPDAAALQGLITRYLQKDGA